MKRLLLHPVPLVLVMCIAFGSFSVHAATPAAGDGTVVDYAAQIAVSLRNSLQAGMNTMLRTLGFTIDPSYTLVSESTDNNGHASTLNQVYQNTRGESLNLSYCANHYIGKTTSTLCQSAPNACGMVGSGFITESQVYYPNGMPQPGTHTYAPCTAQVPADSLCAHAAVPASSSVTDTSPSKCSVTYACVGNTIRYTDASCRTTDYAVCGAQQQCVNGLNSCQPPNASDTVGSGGADGAAGAVDNADTPTLTAELSVTPILVKRGDVVRLVWRSANAATCTLSRSGVGVISAFDSQLAPGLASSPITEHTDFALSCTGVDGSMPSTVEVSRSVDILPVFNER